jgi:hypothetical protein
MEELFKNKTKYTEKEYQRFLQSYQKEYALTDTLYILFYIGFFTFCLVLAIINKEFLLSGILFVGLLIYIWYKFIRTKKKIQKEKSSKKIQKEYITTFNFYKKLFRVKNQDGEAKIFYFKIYKVVETKTHFYIYISRDYAFIVSKKGFINSTPEEFSEFIKKKTFGKYKNRMQ